MSILSSVSIVYYKILNYLGVLYVILYTIIRSVAVSSAIFFFDTLFRDYMLLIFNTRFTLSLDHTSR